MMKNRLITVLSAISEKLKNNYADEGTLERTRCLLTPEINELAGIWDLAPEEALILSGIILWNTEHIFEQCTFQDIARTLGISILELTAHYPQLERLVAEDYITAEEVEIGDLPVPKSSFQRLAVKPGIRQFGFRYYITDRVVGQLFLKSPNEPS